MYDRINTCTSNFGIHWQYVRSKALSRQMLYSNMTNWLTSFCIVLANISKWMTISMFKRATKYFALLQFQSFDKKSCFLSFYGWDLTHNTMSCNSPYLCDIYPWNCLLQVVNTRLFADRIWVEVPAISCYHRAASVNANLTSGIAMNWKPVKVILLRMVNPNRITANLKKIQMKIKVKKLITRVYIKLNVIEWICDIELILWFVYLSFVNSLTWGVAK